MRNPCPKLTLLLLVHFLLDVVLHSSGVSFIRAEDPEEADEDLPLSYDFIDEGDVCYIEYVDERFGDVSIPAPCHFKYLSEVRVLQELDYYFLQGSGVEWSERVVLEIMCHSLSFGRNYGAIEDLGQIPLNPWLNESTSICDWAGITCGPLGPKFPEVGRRLDDPEDYDRSHLLLPPQDAVTSIDLAGYKLEGTLPVELAFLQHLERLNLKANNLMGTIPDELGTLPSLQFVDLSKNLLTGTIPIALKRLSTSLVELWLQENELEGPIHHSMGSLTSLRSFDVSNNNLSGTLPPEIGKMTSLVILYLEYNQLTGKLISEIGNLVNLQGLDIVKNKFRGSIPTALGKLTKLSLVRLADNRLSGSLPSELFLLSNLEELDIDQNKLVGSLPEGGDCSRGFFGWSCLSNLDSLLLHGNHFVGTLPADLFAGLAASLETLDLSRNKFAGTIPTEVGKMKYLESFDVQLNKLTGTIPSELGLLTALDYWNFAMNRLFGPVPKVLCDPERNPRIAYFGCDAVVCPAGTFHPLGSATFDGGCRACPDKTIVVRDEEIRIPGLEKILGRTVCESVEFTIGDLDADGKVSQGEAIRFLHHSTGGRNWGEKYDGWKDMDVHECDLFGVTCSSSKEVVRIDLTDARLCIDDNGLGEDEQACTGLPMELSLLTGLEVLKIKTQMHLLGTIPTELGVLTKLKYLELSGCKSLRATIPSELGRLSRLRVLNLSDGALSGTIPSELFRLEKLETLLLNANYLTGSLHSSFGNLVSAKEISISQNQIGGTIPTSVGDLKAIETLDIYGNGFVGNLPSEIGRCTTLKKIDVYSNKLTGTLPETLTTVDSLQIFSAKMNKFSGTLSDGFGLIPYLFWFDASRNELSGTIPDTFAKCPTLKDLRLGGNRFYGTVPEALCKNEKINSGLSRAKGCDSIACPLGTYSNKGHSSELDTCKPCPEGETTMYLGAVSCIKVTMKDTLSMFFDVMHGETWPEIHKKGWKDKDLSVCDWAGVVCGENEEVIGLSIPTGASDVV